jgi:hypothetical protein
MKQSIFILIFILSLSVYSQNQDYDEVMTMSSGYTPPYSPFVVTGSWSNLSNSPMAVSRTCVAYIEVAGIPYLYQFGGGNSSTDMRRVARLNLNTNTWQNNYSSMPHQVSSGTAIAVNGDSVIYVFGGNLSPGALGKTQKYSVYSNSWETMADMQTRITDALVVKHSDTRIIIVGGGDAFFGSSALKTNKVQVYNTVMNSYSYSTDYPIQCSMLGGGIYRDTIIAVGGYTTGGNATANCYKGVINPVNMVITWGSMPSYPAGSITRMASYVAVRNTGVGIMCTGGAIGGSIPTSATHFWNFCTQSWQTGLPANSLARSNYKASGKGGFNVYTASGYTTILGVGNSEYLTFNLIEGPCQNMVGVGSNSTPVKFELKQNYPNPFNPETKISFSLPTGGQVKIIVTNMQGQEVKELANKIYTAGNYSMDFKADGLSSGVYFYTITTSGFRDTKKMLLVK